MNKWLVEAPKARVWMSKHVAAVCLAVVLLSFVCMAHAQVPGPNILTPAQVNVFDQLVLQAKQVDPQYLQTYAQDAVKRADLSPLGAVNLTASAGSSVSLNSTGGFDQVTPGLRLAASVDFVKLANGLTKSHNLQLDALTASTNAAGRDLRVRVLQAYTAYLSAIRTAGTAADSLEVAQATLRQQQARSAAGAATGVDVLRAAQAKNSADAQLYDNNLRLAVAKQQLSALTGLSLAELDSVLSGAKPKP